MIVVITPCPPAPYPKRWAGLFEARLDGRLLCVSRQPLLDAARLLISEGYDPDTVVAMRHSGSAVDALTAKVGTAAKLTIREGESRPSFSAWVPYAPCAVTRIIALKGPEAIPA